MPTAIIWVAVFGAVAAFAAFICTALGGADLASLSQRQFAQRAKGVVSGMVHHKFMQRYDKTGDVPDKAFRYWGYSTAHGTIGWLSGAAAIGRSTWYPCVQFEAEGRPVSWIAPKGFKKEEWRIGQPVEVLYNPTNPSDCLIVGDTAIRRSAAVHFACAVVLAVLAAVLFSVVP